MSAIATALPAGTYTSDPVHSTTGFAVKHMLATFRGSFAAFDATLTVDEDGRAKLAGSVPVDSVVVKDENLVAHLQSPEFFDAEQHPQLRFRADDVRLDGEEAEVSGEITIKGVTRPLSARGQATGPLVDGFGNERLGLTLTTTIDRTDFGVSWNMPLPTGKKALSDEVTIRADLQLVKAA